ncbi:MAG TPA: Gfo/Idh/MocA family oxidoreductase [Streptosporangiaceae bacterium]|nr:Gfo/Idh/MocA family oxidoreductase [Streptosporangiaceae bacterium]
MTGVSSHPGLPELRLGVLGCASVAWRRTLPAVAATPGIRVTAVASRDPAKAEEFARRFGAEAVAGYEALIGHGGLDAVYIPLPAALHASWVRRALDAGLHVLVEKPLATTAGEATDLVAAARAHGGVLMENFAFVHHSQLAEVHRLVAEGAIGELRSFASEFAFPPLPPDDIRYRPELGGGALLDAGVYPLRAAREFLGDELSLLGASLRVDAGTGVDVAGAALLTAPAGVSATVTFGFAHSYRCALTLWGSDGRICLDRAYTAPDSFAPALRLERAGGAETRDLPPDAQFARLLEAFVRAVRSARGEGGHAPGPVRAGSAGDRPAGDGLDGIVAQAALVERVAIHAHRCVTR